MSTAGGGDAPALADCDGSEGNPKALPPQNETLLSTAVILALAPQVDASKSTKDVPPDLGRAWPPHTQSGGNPKQISYDALGSLAPTPPVKGEGPPPVKGSGLSAAQSMVEGRIAQLPQAAMRQPGAPQGGRTEMPLDPKHSKQSAVQLQQSATTVQGSVPNNTASLMQMPDQVTARDRKLHERATSVAPQLPLPHVPTLGATPVAAIAQPAVAMAQGMQIGDLVVNERTVKASEQDGLLSLVGPDRPAAMPTAVSSLASAGPETARHIAHQIATASVQGNGKATEILLNPEELGRVRMSMSAADGTLTLVVLTDRPETQNCCVVILMSWRKNSGTWDMKVCRFLSMLMGSQELIAAMTNLTTMPRS